MQVSYLSIILDKLINVTYLSSFLNCQIMFHSLIYSFIVQERGVGMVFASSGGWKSVKLIDVNDKMLNVAGEVRTLL